MHIQTRLRVFFMHTACFALARWVRMSSVASIVFAGTSGPHRLNYRNSSELANEIKTLPAPSMAALVMLIVPVSNVT